MREIQLHPPQKRKPPDVIRRLQFFANGVELFAWVGPERFTHSGREGHTTRFHLYSFPTEQVRELHGSWYFAESGETDERTRDPVISADRELFAYETLGDQSLGHGEDGVIWFEDLAEGHVESGRLPHLRSSPQGLGGLAFTADGAELIAVRNIYEGISGNGGHWAPDVVRFEMASLRNPPVRYEEKTNPFTRTAYRAPVYAVRWVPVMPLPHRKVAIIALSADASLLAVGGIGADLHVADLKRKKVLVSFPWEGRFLRDGKPARVGFDPAAQWVVMLANGRLFARPFVAGAGEAWQTKSTLGYIHDFAYHPTGRVLCAVFRDGQARYLDPRSGKVRQSFKWARKPAPLYSVTFAPDGLTCAAGSENGKVILWDVDV